VVAVSLLNTYNGNVAHEGVANAFNLSWTPAEQIIHS